MSGHSPASDTGWRNASEWVCATFDERMPQGTVAFHEAFAAVGPSSWRTKPRQERYAQFVG